MADIDESNLFFQLAADLINNSSRNIFLTGKAGTGKTTFLKYIRESCCKQTAVVAPTGVAAINAGGTTIHSFFQLPFAPFIPGHVIHDSSDASTDVTTKHSLLGRIRLNNEKRKVLESLDLLIIDEISMVRCDMLDAIDVVLRHFRGRYSEVFGGVQLLLIGDMYQLPPVIADDEWRILSQFYSSPYFFSSQAIQQQPPAFISFSKIYRQSDERFIGLLNQVRNNEMDEAAIRLFNERYQPSFQPSKEDGYIILTTHNDKATNINSRELDKLNTPSFTFKATIDGEFNEKAFPAEDLLNLKTGAQVMFIKNDSEKNRRYYNGKIGTVAKIDKDNIFVKCKNEAEEIEVRKETWENIRYTFNQKVQQLEEEIIGSFTQFPLRLAWAITIHKSQGLTFDKCIIDAGAAFAPGQIYVALSRCTNLEGLILHSRVQQSGLENDKRVISFSQQTSSVPQLELQLKQAKHLYQQSLILSLFNFSLITKACEDLLSFLKEHASSFNAESLSWTENLMLQIQALQEWSQKFNPKLLEFFQYPELPNENLSLQTRVASAAKFFSDLLQQSLQLIQISPLITDSRLYAKQFNEKLYELFLLLTEKKFMFDFCSTGFDPVSWHKTKKQFKAPPFTINSYAGSSSTHASDIQHPELYRQLRKLRDDICTRKNQPIYMVAGSNTLNEMTTFLPQDLDGLSKISGFGKVKIQAYGEQFVNIISQYCNQHKLSSVIHEKLPKRQRKEKGEIKKDTKAETYNLYKEGKSVAEIASIRSFSEQTIEGHLAHYVQNGEIEIHELVSREKLILIEPVLKNFEGGNLTPIKQQFCNNVSFGEIRLALAWKEFQKKEES